MVTWFHLAHHVTNIVALNPLSVSRSPGVDLFSRLLGRVLGHPNTVFRQPLPNGGAICIFLQINAALLLQLGQPQVRSYVAV